MVVEELGGAWDQDEVDDEVPDGSLITRCFVAARLSALPQNEGCIRCPGDAHSSFLRSVEYT